MIIVQEIIPFIDEHWEQLTNAPRRVKHTWHSSIAKTMVRLFSCFFPYFACCAELVLFPCLAFAAASLFLWHMYVHTLLMSVFKK